ncbi:MAG: hypothetical protein V7776_10750 [Halopseudomonas aestusnigri]
MQIGGAGSLLGFDRNKEQLRLTELKAVHKVEREKFAQPEPDNTANKAASANARAFFTRGSDGVSSVAHPKDVPTGGAQATLASSQTSQTLFYAQQIASAVPEASSGTNSTSVQGAKSTSHSDAVEAYRELVGKTPGERMRAQVLRSLGMTEEELEQLPPEERKKIEEKITQLIDEKVKSSVAEGITEQEGVSGQTTSNDKRGSGSEQVLITQKSGVSGYSVQAQGAEKSDKLHKALMQSIV